MGAFRRAMRFKLGLNTNYFCKELSKACSYYEKYFAFTAHITFLSIVFEIIVNVSTLMIWEECILFYQIISIIILLCLIKLLLQ